MARPKFALLMLIVLLVARANLCKRLADEYQKDAEEELYIKERLKAVGLEEHTRAVLSWHCDEEIDLRKATENLQTFHVGHVELNLFSGESFQFSLRQTPITDPDTKVVYNTFAGRATAHLGDLDGCFYSGSSSDEASSTFYLCNGVFGLISVSGVEYQIHPADQPSGESNGNINNNNSNNNNNSSRSNNNNNKNNKIQANVQHPVHVFKGTRGRHRSDDMALNVDYAKVQAPRSYPKNDSRGKDFLIELGIFSDAAYYRRLSAMDGLQMIILLLARVAQSLTYYNDREKVGYGVRIMVRHIEFWIEDPKEYRFQRGINENLESFCDSFSGKYPYDILALNTGALDQEDGAVGIGYLNGACLRGYNCFASLRNNALVPLVYAHEIGHLLGLNHDTVCAGGEDNAETFMKAILSDPNKFTPCNKWELGEYMKKDYSQCLFERNI